MQPSSLLIVAFLAIAVLAIAAPVLVVAVLDLEATGIIVQAKEVVAKQSPQQRPPVPWLCLPPAFAFAVARSSSSLRNGLLLIALSAILFVIACHHPAIINAATAQQITVAPPPPPGPPPILPLPLPSIVVVDGSRKNVIAATAINCLSRQ
jgi:hypothetical protein